MPDGRVVIAHGRHYVVALDEGRLLTCFSRGKRSDIAVGDRVLVADTADGQGVIEAVAPRQTLLYRADAFKQKLIAANASQALCVVAVEPPFSDDVLARTVVAAICAEIRPIIVLNKCDLSTGRERARTRLAPWLSLDVQVVEVSACGDFAALHPVLAGQTSVLVGQSGMGKSTLVNALVPGADARTREISRALDTGKHTTTHATLYELPGGGALIDSPGLQEFGLAHLTRDEIIAALPDIAGHTGDCRFRDCRHDSEPGCGVRDAVQAGEIRPARYALFRRLTGLPERAAGSQ